MQLLFMAIFALSIIVADQITKMLVVANIPLHSHISLIPGIINLSYVQNDGAAFSSFRGAQWLFIVIFIIFTIGIIWEYRTRAMSFSTFERWCIAAIYAGGVGNMIDRIRMSYVVDMIETAFMDFPVFNVADCFITCGCIALLVHLIFFNKDFWKDSKK